MEVGLNDHTEMVCGRVGEKLPAWVTRVFIKTQNSGHLRNHISPSNPLLALSTSLSASPVLIHDWLCQSLKGFPHPCAERESSAVGTCTTSAAVLASQPLARGHFAGVGPFPASYWRPTCSPNLGLMSTCIRAPRRIPNAGDSDYACVFICITANVTLSLPEVRTARGDGEGGYLGKLVGGGCHLVLLLHPGVTHFYSPLRLCHKSVGQPQARTRALYLPRKFPL